MIPSVRIYGKEADKGNVYEAEQSRCSDVVWQDILDMPGEANDLICRGVDQTKCICKYREELVTRFSI